MIAVSLKDGEELVDLLLRKEADVNSKSRLHTLGRVSRTSLTANSRLQRPSTFLESSQATLYSLPSQFPTNNLPPKTALHFTASKNNLDVARKLLDCKPPASTRVKDKRGQYAIHRAAAIGSAPMVELLLKNRSPLNPADVAGQTPLHHAIAEGHGE